jgi:acetyltransferase-like isoleucine patch superfamily enzyme
MRGIFNFHIVIRLLSIIRSILRRSSGSISEWLAIEDGMSIGRGTRCIGMQSFGTEPYLITIGNDCLVTDGVRFVCHDGAIQVPFIRDGYTLEEVYAKRSRFGRIVIGNNVFIGIGAVILPNTFIGDNSIIGAGAIVRGHFPESVVIAGNPARVIESLETYNEKNSHKTLVFTTKNDKEARKAEILNSLCQKE